MLQLNRLKINQVGNSSDFVIRNFEDGNVVLNIWCDCDDCVDSIITFWFECWDWLGITKGFICLFIVFACEIELTEEIVEGDPFLHNDLFVFRVVFVFL